MSESTENKHKDCVCLKPPHLELLKEICGKCFFIRIVLQPTGKAESQHLTPIVEREENCSDMYPGIKLRCDQLPFGVNDDVLLRLINVNKEYLQEILKQDLFKNCEQIYYDINVTVNEDYILIHLYV